jgi:transposase
MAARRLTMRRIKEILRLRLDKGLGIREIARSCKVSHSTVCVLLAKAEGSGLTWSMVKEMDEQTLESILYPQSKQSPAAKRPEPDMAWIHRELRKSKNVTLQLLWEEYKQKHPEDGLQYSQFCARYREWRRKIDMPMRQNHIAGEKMFVDFSGETIPIVDLETGEIHQAELFVAVLGASSYTYVEACRSQDLSSWIQAHCNAFEFIKGVPKVIVPDNLKSGVKDPDYYEPDANPTYLEMAEHYDTAIIPARPYKSRDKAKVESGVLQVERWIVAALRNRIFTSLADLNATIGEWREKLNNKPFQKLDGSRRVLYEELDCPALNPLPSERYVFVSWRKAIVNIDYHIEVEKAYYSVPYQLVREEVDVRLSANTVEVLHKGHRVASHSRAHRKGYCSTHRDHMPAAHRAHAEWSPSRLINWGRKVGPQTGAFVEELLESKRHPEQGYRACLGILRLSKAYPPQRVEAACSRALTYNALSYKSVASILKNGLDQIEAELPQNAAAVSHENVRGAAYYSVEEGV